MANVQEGLKDVVAAETKICFIDGEIGKLLYRGYNIEELAENASFEEVAYLLWHGSLPKRHELEAFQTQLANERAVPSHVYDLLCALPRTADPMDALRTAVSFLASLDPEMGDNSKEANLRKAVRLTAKVPTLVAAFHRHRQNQDLLEPRKENSLAGNFLYMLFGVQPDAYVAKTLDTCLVLHADHGFNASTFAARVTAATLSDMYAAVVSAIGALKGPLHGGANFVVLEMLKDIGNVDHVRPYIHSVLEGQRNVPGMPPKRIAGFGHRVYKAMDPRAKVLRKMSRTLAERAGDFRWIEISEEVERVMEDIGMTAKGVYPNVDFFSASAYYTMGMDVSLFTPLFAISRTAGWTAHIIEQHENNRLIRPIELYTGPKDLSFVPLHER